MLCHAAGLSYLTDEPASVPLGRNTGQDFVLLEFSQELDSLHPPGHPVQLWMDKAQRYILSTLGT